MEEEDLFDWELLHVSDTESIDSFTSDEKSPSSNVIDDGMILSDHFSVDSTDPSQYGSDSPYRMHNRVDIEVNSSSDRRSTDSGVGYELGLNDSSSSCEVEVKVSDFESTKEKLPDLERIEDLNVLGDSRILNGDEEKVSSEAIEVVDVNSGGDESKSREIMWWKMPFVFVKYSVFKVGPVWSISMAAAVVGLVLLGRRRRLYDTNKKTQRFNLKVTIDDKVRFIKLLLLVKLGLIRLRSKAFYSCKYAVESTSFVQWLCRLCFY